MRSPIVAVALASLVAGCGFGIRAGTGVSRTSKAVTLADPIDPTSMRETDATMSASWLETETFLDLRFFRAIGILGGGNQHVRYRGAPGMPTEGLQNFDEQFVARFGGGAAVSPGIIGGFRPVAYALYSNNFGQVDNASKTTLEYGVRLEFVDRLSWRTTSNFNVGLALVSEEGRAYVTYPGQGLTTWQGTFETTGVLATFGWHFGLESFSSEPSSDDDDDDDDDEDEDN